MVQPWRKNVLRNQSQSGQRRGHCVWMIVIHFYHWQLTQADKSLQGTVLQWKITLKLVDQQTEFVLYPLFNRPPIGWHTIQTDHTAHDWCDHLFRPQMSRPALFITACSLLSWYWGNVAKANLLSMYFGNWMESHETICCMHWQVALFAVCTALMMLFLLYHCRLQSLVIAFVVIDVCKMPFCQPDWDRFAWRPSPCGICAVGLPLCELSFHKCCLYLH